MTNASLIASSLLASFDPVWLMQCARYKPDIWQVEIARYWGPRLAVLVVRQGGKSLVSAAKAVSTALCHANAEVIIVCPAEKQAKNVLRYCKRLLNSLPPELYHLISDSATSLEFSNGTRIHALPARHGTARSLSNVRLAILDEDAYIPGEMYSAIEPMLVPGKSQLIRLSTPFGKQGAFYDIWNGPDEKADPENGYKKVKVTIYDVPRRYTPAIIRAKQRDPLLARTFAQEYLCEFTELLDATFSASLIQAALDPNLDALLTPEQML